MHRIRTEGWPLALGVVLLASCGGGSSPGADEPSAAAGGEAPMMIGSAGAAAETAAVVAPSIDAARLSPDPIEPLALRPIAYENRPTGALPVRIAELTVRGGGAFRPPSGPCQDVLVFVRAGQMLAVGAGIAPPSAPSTVYPQDAIRFGPEGDGLLRNDSAQDARSIVAYVTTQGEARFDAAGPADCPSARGDDPLVNGIRVASVRTTEPLEALDGHLHVRILLDTDGVGARHGGLSVLEGAIDLRVPQHRHAEAAEVLYVEDGFGTMQIGERGVAVYPGVVVFVPPGVLHSFTSDDATSLRAIQVYSPSGPEQRFR